MNDISVELKLALVSWIVGMLGLLIAFNFSETTGIVVVFLSILVGFYAVMKGQLSFFKKLKSRPDKNEQ